MFRSVIHNFRCRKQGLELIIIVNNGLILNFYSYLCIAKV